MQAQPTSARHQHRKQREVRYELPVADAVGVPSAIPIVAREFLPGRKGSRQGKVNTAGKGAWDDIGALKAWLRDDLVGERNRYAREVVKDVEARKGKAGRLSGGR